MSPSPTKAELPAELGSTEQPTPSVHVKQWTLMPSFLFMATQTNVYPRAQRRKMRPFEGFQRKAIVIVPEDEEFKRRCEQREKEEGKDVPDSAVLEMKGWCPLLYEQSSSIALLQAEYAGR